MPEVLTCFENRSALLQTDSQEEFYLKCNIKAVKHCPSVAQHTQFAPQSRLGEHASAQILNKTGFSFAADSNTI